MQSIPLENNMGYIQKKTAGKPANGRYAPFSEGKQQEKFRMTIENVYSEQIKD